MGLMNHLSKIARSAPPSTGVQFRKSHYGSKDIRQFLRDVIAMANASGEGPRYIFTGIDCDGNGNGKKRLHSVPTEDFSGKPSYQSLVADFIEPPMRVRYKPMSIEGKRIGVYEIADCQDKPYMMRVDESETLRRGDAYIRVENTAIKMGRRQLQDMFERKFRDAVSPDRIEIGFPGDIIHKDLKLRTTDLSKLPSAIVSSKLKELIDIRVNSRNTGSTTVMARLTHARLFGADNPYEERSPSTLLQEMAQIKSRHENDDQHFLFEEHANPVQLVIYNQGEEPIENASLTLVMPNHNAFYVANGLPHVLRNGQLVDRSPKEKAGYPSVNLKDDAVHVSSSLGTVPVDTPVQAFEAPLRVCVGSDSRGRRVGIRYSLFGKNLRNPVKGTLRLLF
jgi:hypothetical protein